MQGCLINPIIIVVVVVVVVVVDVDVVVDAVVSAVVKRYHFESILDKLFFNELLSFKRTEGYELIFYEPMSERDLWPVIYFADNHNRERRRGKRDKRRVFEEKEREQ